MPSDSRRRVCEASSSSIMRFAVASAPATNRSASRFSFFAAAASSSRRSARSRASRAASSAACASEIFACTDARCTETSSSSLWTSPRTARRSRFKSFAWESMPRLSFTARLSSDVYFVTACSRRATRSSAARSWSCSARLSPSSRELCSWALRKLASHAARSAPSFWYRSSAQPRSAAAPCKRVRSPSRTWVVRRPCSRASSPRFRATPSSKSSLSRDCSTSLSRARDVCKSARVASRSRARPAARPVSASRRRSASRKLSAKRPMSPCFCAASASRSAIATLAFLTSLVRLAAFKLALLSDARETLRSLAVRLYEPSNSAARASEASSFAWVCCNCCVKRLTDSRSSKSFELSSWSSTELRLTDAVNWAMLSSAASNCVMPAFTSFWSRCALTPAFLASERETFNLPLVSSAISRNSAATASDAASFLCTSLSSPSNASPRFSEVSRRTFKSVNSLEDRSTAFFKDSTSAFSSWMLRSFFFTSDCSRSATFVELWNSMFAVFSAASFLLTATRSSATSASALVAAARASSRCVSVFFTAACTERSASSSCFRSAADFSTNTSVSWRLVTSSPAARPERTACRSRSSILVFAPFKVLSATYRRPLNDLMLSSAALSRAAVSRKSAVRWFTWLVSCVLRSSRPSPRCLAAISSAVQCSIVASASRACASRVATFLA
mmetsp:Transcript_47102/g.143107  ORF Transcript_47102/g.143107 Transcript_47102/m.143107 type:complete len:676 (-) Transcript_47102:495-2522(-)